jgi:hypothetical protein
MKNQGYKANRPTTSQVEANYLKGQIKAIEKKIERWERVNNRNIEKGQEPKYSLADFNELQKMIEEREEKLYG